MTCERTNYSKKIDVDIETELRREQAESNIRVLLTNAYRIQGYFQYPNYLAEKKFNSKMFNLE